MVRDIITIDEEKCTGCGLCIPNCPEGAIQLIDGKARLISDIMCDGLGACIGYCPEDAITVEKREAEEYDERKVMANIVKQGENTIRAHLNHLKDHGQEEFYQVATQYLTDHNIALPKEKVEKHIHFEGCPGSHSMSFKEHAKSAEARENDAADTMLDSRPSQLSHWPIQMHLISPRAPHYQGSDLLLAADCTAFTLGEFHRDYLTDKTLAIACPKLDSETQIYQEKLRLLIEEAEINSLTVMIMQVPCCRGLLHLAQSALAESERQVPLSYVVVGVDGNILAEEKV